MRRGFTLLELIIVIVILGILATLGYSQYTKMVEKGRIAEVVANFGKMRKLAIIYYLQNGTFTGITNADVGVGSDLDSIPDSCRSSNYFRYSGYADSAVVATMTAFRCTAGGKEPQWGGAYYRPNMQIRGDTGTAYCSCWDNGLGQWGVVWCIPCASNSQWAPP
jgi:prepilin-type N-terminal cleavage/methylation domain-containing protein